MSRHLSRILRGNFYELITRNYTTTLPTPPRGDGSAARGLHPHRAGRSFSSTAAHAAACASIPRCAMISPGPTCSERLQHIFLCHGAPTSLSAPLWHFHLSNARCCALGDHSSCTSILPHLSTRASASDSFPPCRAQEHPLDALRAFFDHHQSPPALAHASHEHIRSSSPLPDTRIPLRHREHAVSDAALHPAFPHSSLRICAQHEGTMVHKVLATQGPRRQNTRPASQRDRPPCSPLRACTMPRGLANRET